uniref:Large ribosomal subunit protein uL11m n=1 Tax=Chrysotila carterae TaxID=13221 RepID=A0A7S4BKH9_CHRCT|mmetsp:Transcript_43650/g.95457  ORF Transcript_43650/g.95457 Transcript_43650/m.95457 type:complete len:159 (+) Transcript_43650:268-744(+)
MLKPASIFKLTVGAGKATPQPPVGSMLGQRGLNLMNFCKAFNDQTQQYVAGLPMQVQVKSYADRTFTFDVLLPTATYFLLKAAKLEKGAPDGTAKVGRLSVTQIYEIAKLRYEDPSLRAKFRSLEGLCRSMVASCGSMGIEVYDPRPERKATQNKSRA